MLKDVQIVGNTALETSQFVLTTKWGAGPSYIENVSISGNTIENVNPGDIYLFHLSGIDGTNAFENNILKMVGSGSGGGVNIDGGSGDWTIAGNELECTTRNFDGLTVQGLSGSSTVELTTTASTLLKGLLVNATEGPQITFMKIVLVRELCIYSHCRSDAT